MNRKKPDVYGNNALNTHGMEYGGKRGKKGKDLTKMTPLTCRVLQKNTGERRVEALLLHWLTYRSPLR